MREGPSALSAGDPDLTRLSAPGGTPASPTGERYKIAKRNGGHSQRKANTATPGAGERRVKAACWKGGAPVTCRPADLLKPELAELEADVRRRAREKGIQLAGPRH
ncbi:hypothetical protein KCP71_01550 [Salmonella enterica subsp. enterica]|nr:hypothetical protein KCP71_01550 [Salmonella enterica subsp. enterica]